MKTTKIDWCDATINPVIGCKHNCAYCFARKINARFGFVKDFTQPEFFPERLKQFSAKTPKTIFINSMSDVAFWQDGWIATTLIAIISNPQHRYIALTKNIESWFYSLSRIIRSDKHFWQPIINRVRSFLFVGETITTQVQANWFNEFRGVHFGGDFINIEPILESVNIERHLGGGRCKQVIIGAETGNRKGKVIPEADWVRDIVEQCNKYGVLVFMKESLRQIMGADFRQDPLIWAINKTTVGGGND